MARTKEGWRTTLHGLLVFWILSVFVYFHQQSFIVVGNWLKNILGLTSNTETYVDPRDLPVVPSDPFFFKLDHKYNVTFPSDKKIPRIVWIAFKEVPGREQMHEVLVQQIDRWMAANWTVNLMSNNDKEDFMTR